MRKEDAEVRGNDKDYVFLTVLLCYFRFVIYLKFEIYNL